MMGNGIAVRSQLSQGSLFSFCIAVTADETAVAEVKTAIAGNVIGLAPQQPAYRILIAEDNPTNRLLLTKLLGSVGFELQEATHGQAAIDLWQTWHPDLIFMDMRMPIMNGQEAVEKLRALEAQQHEAEPHGAQNPPRKPRTKVIALTASAFAEQRQEMMAAGCDDFIHKPFKVQEIFEKIARHLNVDYLYQALSDDSTAQALSTAEPQTLQPTLLQGPSSDWIERLHWAAVHGNDLQIVKLTEDIAANHPALAKILKRLAENFQFDKITDVTVAGLSSAPAG